MINVKYCLLIIRFKEQKEFTKSHVTYKQKRLKQQSASLNMSRTPARKPVHFRFDEDGEVMEVKPSEALSKAKRFLEAVKTEEQENQDNEQATTEQFSDLLRTENNMPVDGVSGGNNRTVQKNIDSSSESDSSDSSDEEPSSLVLKGEGEILWRFTSLLLVQCFERRKR